MWESEGGICRNCKDGGEWGVGVDVATAAVKTLIGWVGADDDPGNLRGTDRVILVYQKHRARDGTSFLHSIAAAFYMIK